MLVFCLALDNFTREHVIVMGICCCFWFFMILFPTFFLVASLYIVMLAVFEFYSISWLTSWHILLQSELKSKWELEKSVLEKLKNEAEEKYDEVNEQVNASLLVALLCSHMTSLNTLTGSIKIWSFTLTDEYERSNSKSHSKLHTISHIQFLEFWSYLLMFRIWMEFCRTKYYTVDLRLCTFNWLKRMVALSGFLLKALILIQLVMLVCRVWLVFFEIENQ